MTKTSKKKPNEFDIHVGQRVRMARSMIKMSQERLGELLGVTFQQVQKYEKGTNRIGSSRLVQISQALGKPVSWFFEGLEEGKVGDNALERAFATPDGARLLTTFINASQAQQALIANLAATVVR